jgi:hypothetical protein
MISFQRASLFDSILNLWPSRKKRLQVEMRATIKYLVDHPDVPCMIENIFVPHGYGNNDCLCKTLYGFNI